MNRTIRLKGLSKRLLGPAVTIALTFCSLLQATGLRAQEAITVNLAAVDGVDITPDNIFNFQIYSQLTAATSVTVTGTLRYRNSEMKIAYSFQTTINQGVNMYTAAMVQPRWDFSSQALKELFLDYKKLPQGTYEYCVDVVPSNMSGETIGGERFEACLYNKSDDIFLIQLIDPENNAKIYEYNPMLSWIVNYPFAAGLSYTLRVAEAKEGQNNSTAINRNNPIYKEANLYQLSQVYPVYAKPLQLYQPYVWTVDAYYKGILLGGAEPWRFTIIEDTPTAAIPRESNYIDIKLEHNSAATYAVGVLKIKYVLDDARTDSLRLEIQKENGKVVPLKQPVIGVTYGDNRFIMDFLGEGYNLGHLKRYTLTVKNSKGATYVLPFKYVNPEFLK